MVTGLIPVGAPLGTAGTTPATIPPLSPATVGKNIEIAGKIGAIGVKALKVLDQFDTLPKGLSGVVKKLPKGAFIEEGAELLENIIAKKYTGSEGGKKFAVDVIGGLASVATSIVLDTLLTPAGGMAVSIAFNPAQKVETFVESWASKAIFNFGSSGSSVGNFGAFNFKGKF